MLHTAKPDPVISAHVHHHTKSLYEAVKCAILKVHTVRSARFTAMIERRGPVERSVPFSLRLPGVRDRDSISDACTSFPTGDYNPDDSRLQANHLIVKF